MAQKIEVARGEKPPAGAPAQGSLLAPLGSLRSEVDRLFDQFMTRAWARPFEVPPSAWLDQAIGTAMPAVDVAEKDGGYEITAELPGLDAKNVQVQLAGETLTISGEKSEEKEEKDKNYHLSERRYGSFRRSFRLPPGVDAAKIDAKFDKGVLKVTLPKNAAAAAPKTIEVKAA